MTVDAAPAGGRRLRNFRLTAIATDRNTHHEVRQAIRVHVHDALMDAWLTPTSLTLRPTQNQFEASRVSFLARFDDEVIGDIGNWSPLEWSTDPPSAVLPDVSDIQIVDASDGGIIARRTGARAQVTVTYPPLGLTRHAQVTCIEEWATPRDVTWISGKDPAKWREVRNVLFLPDGFTDGERDLFETLVRNITRKLRTVGILRPFDTLHGAMNYWAAFVPSNESGFSLIREVYTREDAGGLIAGSVPYDQAPSASAASWSVAELIHEVGLPVKADAGRDLDGDSGLLKVWQRLYGPQVTRPRVEKSWLKWRELATRTLLNERDTVFGLRLGVRPQLGGGLDTLFVSSDRASRSGINRLVANLLHRGEAVGESWRPSSGTAAAGKDFGLVCLLPRTRFGRASNVGDHYIGALGSASEHYVRPVAAGGFEIVPVRVKRKAEPMPAGEERHPSVDVDDPSIDAVTTIAHETGHTLLLGDEYAESGSGNGGLPASTDLSEDANLQGAQSVLSPTTGKLESSRIKWADWHRIEKAGVLAQDPDPPQRRAPVPAHPRARASPDAFKEGDLVRLRRRPLIPDTLVSHVMRVARTPSAGQAHLDVTVAFEGWTSPGDFRAGAMLIKMLRWPFQGLGANLGEELTLMARIIREHLDASQLPLNARPGRALDACDFDHAGQQQARNLPSGLPKCRPRNRNRIVGLFEGGAQHHCGVYHPTGACIMRDHRVDSLIPFCPVCRYVLVDLIDPTQHGIIDRDYAKIYPDPRL